MDSRRFKWTPQTDYDVPSVGSSRGIWERQYNGDPEIRDNLAKELAASRKKGVSKKNNTDEFALSDNDVKKINELKSAKVENIENIPARKQARIRRIINQERVQQNKPEIKYPDDINPHHRSYKKRYAQLIVDYYNAELDHSIDKIHSDTVYKYVYKQELKKVKKYDEGQIKEKLNDIPHNVQYEILCDLNINPQSAIAKKKEIQQKIVAIFNTEY